MPNEPSKHRSTLMTVHAHPDDETIGTGGSMAKAVRAGHRVVLITCTRGEMGEIVIPEMDTPVNHRRLGELRAAELERAMVHLGVTEWDNLGYRDSDMMGRPANHDPRCFWQAHPDEAARRLVWLIRRYQPDVITTYNEFGGYGHPDHIRTHEVVVRAWPQAGDPARYPEQLAPEFGGSGPPLEEGGVAPWAPSKLYEQAMPASVRGRLEQLLAERGQRNPWAPPADASPEQLQEFEARALKMLVPDERVTTWIDIDGGPLEAKWAAMGEHVTQLGPEFPFIAIGFEAWRQGFAREAFILRESRVATAPPETDLFAGIGQAMRDVAITTAGVPSMPQKPGP